MGTFPAACGVKENGSRLDTPLLAAGSFIGWLGTSPSYGRQPKTVISTSGRDTVLKAYGLLLTIRTFS